MLWRVVAAGLLMGAQWLPGQRIELPPMNNPPSSWTRKLSLEVAAPDTKRGGAAWDVSLDSPFMCVPGTPFCTGTSKVASSHPDLWLIIFDAQGNRTAYLTPPGQHLQQNPGLMARLLDAMGVKPYSRCPNSLVCQYHDIQLPEGAFGVVILDQDYAEHDAMLAGVVIATRTAAGEVKAIEEHVHAYLDDLTKKGQLKDGGYFAGKLPTVPMAACEQPKQMCFLDSTAGRPGLRVTTLDEVVAGLVCEATTQVTGKVAVAPGRGKEMLLEFRAAVNSCPGTVSYEWEFEDGSREVTRAPSVKHRFEDDRLGVVKVTARCHEGGRACEVEPAEFDLGERKR